MTKIKTISISNLKAIAELTIDLNGCSAIITGGNNKGKSTLLKSLPDRIRGERPELIVKDGEEEGKGEMTLTTGEKFTWEFNKKGKDRLSFFTKEGYPAMVTKEVSNRFFKPLFDIDEFLNAMPQEKIKMLQKLLGLDFTDIDARYTEAYRLRTEANRDFKKEESKILGFRTIPEKVEAIDTTKLIEEKTRLKGIYDEQLKKNQAHNKRLRDTFEAQKTTKRNELRDSNAIEEEKGTAIADIQFAIDTINNTCTEYGIVELVDIKKLIKHRDYLPVGKMVDIEAEILKMEAPKEIEETPDTSEIDAIDEQINNASEIANKANDYKNHQAALVAFEETRKNAKELDARVKHIEQEKKDMIAKSKLPKGFLINEFGIFVDDLSLEKNQISSSKLYCAALRLAAINLGEVRTLHFDASTLDKTTLGEIEAWAKENDLQLLIERPDYEGGEIEYRLITE